MTYKLIFCLSYFNITVTRISNTWQDKTPTNKIPTPHFFNYLIYMVATTLFQLPNCRKDLAFNHHKFGKTILEPFMLSIYKNVFKYQSDRKTLKKSGRVWKKLKMTLNRSLFHCVCTSKFLSSSGQNRC